MPEPGFETETPAISLNAFLAGIQEHDGSYQAQSIRQWSQGRTLYGGLTTTTCVAVAMRAFPDLPPLRSAQIAFSGPTAGLLDLKAVSLRRGRNSAVIRVDMVADDVIAASALLTFAAAKPSHIAHSTLAMPAVPSPDQCEPFFGANARAPRFASNFDMRLAAGHRPISSSSETRCAAWIKYIDYPAGNDTQALVALADALPPAVIAQYTGPSRISSMTWGLDVLATSSNNGWKLLQSTSEWAADGYSSQAMTLWDSEGTALAVGRQLIALFE
ncbi:thioesterase family protein [Sphingobium phenoxybenzoativorans]|uniref:Thioesterase family protein n=1 Tax=Sphingobium phenoxybenzoativorans TaxID=1592790 RepID=A0A975Q3E3_9SPHN|nr:thioesterase family protein [Sphingobium phenoxybenzoativorans]QUT07809.1 thioesterase family protein [Sphingobium phenoxybenzoativorans]